MPGTDADEPDDAGGGAGGSNVSAFPGCIRPVVEASAPGAEDAAARLDQALLALTQGLGDLAGSLGSLADGLRALDVELQAAAARPKTSMDENGRKVVKPADLTGEAAPASEQPLDPSSD